MAWTLFVNLCLCFWTAGICFVQLVVEEEKMGCGVPFGCQHIVQLAS